MALRVCLISSSYAVSSDDVVGAGVFLAEIVAELQERGCQVTVLAPNHPSLCPDGSTGDLHLFDWFRPKRPTTSLKPYNPLDMLSTISYFRRGSLAAVQLHQERRFDVALAAWALPSGVQAAYLKRHCGVPYVVWALGSDIAIGKRILPLRILLRRVLLGASKQFADGIALAADVESISGVRCEFLPSARAETGLDDGELDLDPMLTHFLFVGRWAKVKGIDVLLRAVPIALQETNRFHVHIAGGGPLERLVRTMSARPDTAHHVTVHGRVSDAMKASLLRSCDYLVLPSRSESIPMVLSEAARAGLPALVTNVGDMAQLIDQYAAGAIVPPGDAARLAGEIVRLSGTDPGSYRAGALRLAAQFDIGRISDRLAAALAAVAHRDTYQTAVSAGERL